MLNLSDHPVLPVAPSASRGPTPRNVPALRGGRALAAAHALALVSVSLLSMTTAGCGGGEASQSQASQPGRAGAPLEVSVARVRQDIAGRTVTAAGVVQPIRSASPGSRLIGVVTDARFDEGDRVRAGQVLVSIDARELEARGAQAAASVREAQAGIVQASGDLARMETLYAKGFLPRARLDQARATMARARASLDTASGAVREVEANAAYSRVRAPFAGIIVRKTVETGNLVTPGQSLFVIEDQSQMRVVASVGEDIASRLRPGDRLLVELPGHDHPEPGVVETVLPSGDPGAPGFRVRLLLDNFDHTILSGMSARVRLPSAGAPSSRRLVSDDAILRRGQLTGVFVIDHGRARLRWISLGPADGRFVEVLSGLEAGEQVVVGPQVRRLSDGQAVAPGPEIG